MAEKVSDPVAEADAKFVFEHCEAMGYENARTAIAGGCFTPNLQKLGELWLRLQEEKRQEKLNRENRRMARRTELAAWLAAAFALVAILPFWRG